MNNNVNNQFENLNGGNVQPAQPTPQQPITMEQLLKQTPVQPTPQVQAAQPVQPMPQVQAAQPVQPMPQVQATQPVQPMPQSNFTSNEFSNLNPTPETKNKQFPKKLIAILLAVVAIAVILIVVFSNLKTKSNQSIKDLKFYVPDSWEKEEIFGQYAYLSKDQKCGISIMYADTSESFEDYLSSLEEEYGSISSKQINGKKWHYKDVSDNNIEKIYAISHESGIYLVITANENNNSSCSKEHNQFEKSLKFD